MKLPVAIPRLRDFLIIYFSIAITQKKHARLSLLMETTVQTWW